MGTDRPRASRPEAWISRDSMTLRSEPQPFVPDPAGAIPGEPLGASRIAWPALATLVALCAPLFFLGMGRMALIDPDEPYYAVPALEMLRAGSWRVPLFHGQPWFDKPILFYWILLAGFRVLGTTELAARLGSGLAALAGVLALALHARRRARARGSVPGILEMLLP